MITVSLCEECEWLVQVIVVGPPDHGKSSLAQIITAYALRLDRTPLFVDLDVGHSPISIPGTVAAVPLDKTCLNVEVFLSSIISCFEVG